MHHVVVVDDAETNLEILTAMVEGRPETTPHPFLSSSQALAYAEQGPVDAFVLDYNMPDPDGRAMIRLLRGDTRFAFVPIIIVTSDAERAHRLAALSAGANDFVERPIEQAELLARLDTLLALQDARRRLTEDVSDLTESLRIEERHSREQAERMVALWQIVSNAEISTDDVLHAILGEGARSMRPGRHFVGALMRLDGGDLVIEATARETVSPTRLAPIGGRIAFADTIPSLLPGVPATMGWIDVPAVPELAARYLVRDLKMQAVICTSFRAGPSTYYLLFWTGDAVTEPFRKDDYAYVELLASYFGARLHQSWQHTRISYQLSHDSLTGLRNRTQFRVDTRAALREHGCGTLVIVNVDGFRHINETYGHIIGDALLVEVGAALQSRAAEADVIGRLAGDAFGIFIAGVADEQTARERLAAYAEVFTRSFSTGDREGRETIPLTASIGAATAVGDHEINVDALLAHADTAVYAAKREGRSKTVFFAPGMESEAAVRTRLLEELALAVAGDQFEMVFQPHVDLETGHVGGAEALIRWNHPHRGLVLPDEFIPFAEEHGYIRTISMWVLRTTLRASEALRAIDPGFRLYFNLSAVDLSDRLLVQEFRDAVRLGVHLENVGVELTETAAMVDLGVTIQTVRALRELGVAVAIDDFGVGYSSLSLLKRLPVDLIKIDRSFISDVLTDERDAAITESVIRVAQRLGFQTLGEGVETNDQLAWLAARKCRYAQGYLWGQPLRFEAFATWLQHASASSTLR